MTEESHPTQHWAQTVVHVRNVIIALVGIYILIAQALVWFGEKRTSPAEAVQQLSRQLQRSDSMARQDIRALTRATRVNSYSICLLSRRPQQTCEDILIDDGIPRVR